MDKKRTILVIEDEQSLLDAVSAKLDQGGFDVMTAKKVDQALNYMADGVHFDAVWLDHYLLGKGTGLDFLAGMKEYHKYRKTPVFVVSNTAGPNARHGYLRFGVEKYYVKSDNRLDTIISEIKEYLECPDE